MLEFIIGGFASAGRVSDMIASIEKGLGTDLNAFDGVSGSVWFGRFSSIVLTLSGTHTLETARVSVTVFFGGPPISGFFGGRAEDSSSMTVDKELLLSGIKI